MKKIVAEAMEQGAFGLSNGLENAPERFSNWAFILTLSGTFKQLFTFVMFIAIIFWITGAGSVFMLRKKDGSRSLKKCLINEEIK